MSEWTPRRKRDARTEALSLTGEEGFVLSRIDGTTSTKTLAQSTGLPEARVRQILKKLVKHGAVEDGESASAPLGIPGMPPLARAPVPVPARAPVPDPIPFEVSAAELDEALGDPTTEEPLDLDDDAIASVEDVVAEAEVQDALANAPEEAQIDEAPTDDNAPPPAEEEQEAPTEEEPEEANYRKLYMTVLAKLEGPAREALAKTAKDAELLALCFDPLPAVIKAVFENMTAGFAHARLVARHHRTPQGLDVVMHRHELFRDAQVQKLLLQNPMLQEPQLRHVLQSKRLADVYKVTISREIPERNRQKSRLILRNKWSTAEAEERAGLVFTTEGRCLTMLTGLPFDSHTTSLLCSRSYNSILMIQNLARFGATPPQVLVHLMKQPLVKRQQQLRTIIMQHPNCPSELKRRV